MTHNLPLARAHFRGLKRSLDKDPHRKEHHTNFMSAAIEKGHASPVPPDETVKEPGRV